MSRLSKKPIIIPDGVSVEFKDGELRVKGPKGELARKVSQGLDFEISEKEVFVKTKDNSKNASALSGTFVRHLKNMIEGTERGFEKKLEIEGIGFKAEVKGEDLVLNLGFSHPLSIRAPEGVSFSVEKNKITVSGIDKEAVGNISSTIRSKRKPEPYKGKGIHYVGEVIRRKAGKKMAATA